MIAGMADTPASKRAAAPPPSDVHLELLRQISDSVEALHAKVDRATSRLNEAEKLLDSPALKAFTKVKSAWKGL